jgi:ribosome-associated protein YbcJ (S4-like RNA binding protein)
MRTELRKRCKIRKGQIVPKYPLRYLW